MHDDRKKWNAKYASGAGDAGPSDSVIRFASQSRVGRALDIAAGAGRNALYLARQGFKVDAVDISEVGLRRISGKHPHVRAICADLDRYEIPAQTYDLIININFLQRRLFPLIIEGLALGGLLIFETFVEGGHPTRQQPECRDYLLRPNELLRAFLPLHILHYSEEPLQPPEKASHMALLVGLKK